MSLLTSPTSSCLSSLTVTSPVSSLQSLETIWSRGLLRPDDEVQTQLPNQLFLGHVGGLSRPCKDIYYIHTGVFKFVIRFLLRINVVTIMCKYLFVAVPPSWVRCCYRVVVRSNTIGSSIKRVTCPTKKIPPSHFTPSKFLNKP